MKTLCRLALGISVVLVLSLVAAGRGQGAEMAGTALHDGRHDDHEGGGRCREDDDCDDGNPCTKDTCHRKSGKKRGTCAFKPRDTRHGRPIVCDDGSACTQSDSCQAGICTGTNPVACAASDQCHVAGTCDPATGACSDPAAADGTACNDTDACTRSDSCQLGACMGADAVACSASDQCHVAGTCDPASGACSDPAAPDGTACTDTVTCSGADVCDAGECGHNGNPRTAIVFASGRDHPAFGQNRLEIYLMDGAFTNPRGLTVTEPPNTYADSMPSLSPDGKGRIVFDSNRLRVPPERLNTSDLFLMKDDGSLQTFLVRGSSATWSPDSQSIAFHRSRSGTGQPDPRIPDLGAPTTDSDIFVAKVCDLVAGLPPTNLTESAEEIVLIDDDASWSPDGQKILWTAHNPNVPNYDPLVRPSQDIWVMNADGSGRANLTNSDGLEERSPSWSPDGTLIAYMCRIGLQPDGATNPNPTFEICVMNADGSGLPRRLTVNTVPDGTPTWSPDGTQILFNRLVTPPLGNQQLFIMNADGSGQARVTPEPPEGFDGFNLFGSFGQIKDAP